MGRYHIFERIMCARFFDEFHNADGNVVIVFLVIEYYGGRWISNEANFRRGCLSLLKE
jgi:hypothetical protein